MFFLKAGSRFIAVGFNNRLAPGVIARGWQRFQSSLFNRLTTTSANAVTSFFYPEQSLINVGDETRFVLAQTQSNLLVDIHKRHIDAVRESVIRKFERRSLLIA